MGSIVSVKQRARKKTIAITAFGGSQFPARHDEQARGTSYRPPQQQAQTTTERQQHHGIIKTSENQQNFKSVQENKSGDPSHFVNKRELIDIEQGEETRKEAPNFDQQECTGHGKENNLRNHGDSGNVEADTELEHPRHSIEKDFPLKQHGTADTELSEKCQEKKVVAKGEGNASIHNDCKTKSIKLQKLEINLPIDSDVGTKATILSESGTTAHKYDHHENVSAHQKINRTPSPVNHAFGSWGEGVLGTTELSPQMKGHVTSRGINATVKSSSAEFYGGFASVNSFSPRSNIDQIKDEPQKIRHKTGACMCYTCIESRKREHAALKIQKTLRGYQARREILHKRDSVIKIQRIFRAKAVTNVNLKPEGLRPRRKSSTESNISWTGTTRSATPSQPLSGAGHRTKESFEMYQEDITDLKWKSQQLIEVSTMGDEYEPQKILLIASNIQKPNWLVRTTLQDVHVILYQFSDIKLEDILNNISLSLNDYRPGSKAKRIAFMCHGGPGYMYLCKGKVLTSKKLKMDKELRAFVKGLGEFITKMEPTDAKIHIIGNNILGSKKGVNLLKDIRNVMKPCRVCIESPFEISESGIKMLNDYFDVDSYKVWKLNRYIKTWMPI